MGQRAAALHPPARTAHPQAACSSFPPPTPLQEELQTLLADKVSAFEDLEARLAKLEEDTSATQAGAVGWQEGGLWLSGQGCACASL